MAKALAVVIIFLALLGGVYFYLNNKPVETDVVTAVEDSIQDEHKTKKPKRKLGKRLAPIDSIAIHKSERELLVFNHGSLVKTYAVSLGPSPEGDKEYEGDGKTPEGWYYINGKNPNSLYHKNLGVSYPNAEDIAHAAAIGKHTGGDIKIHGLPQGYEGYRRKFLAKDWTAGCIAVSNKEIDELYEAVKVGTPVLITP